MRDFEHTSGIEGQSSQFTFADEKTRCGVGTGHNQMKSTTNICSASSFFFSTGRRFKVRGASAFMLPESEAEGKFFTSHISSILPYINYKGM